MPGGTGWTIDEAAPPSKVVATQADPRERVSRER